MQLTICQKHQKKEKIGQRILLGSNVCLNRYCPNAYTIICPQCKNQHRDHSIKILSLEDINQQIKRLLKTPLALSNKYIIESIDIMKKIKLIKQFRRKIDILESDMIREAVTFIDITQAIIHQYATCKQSVNQLSEKLNQISDPQIFKEFKLTCNKYFSQIEYNFKKQKMELGNLVIKQKQDKRRKLLEVTRRRIQQVKDYSMKIIEVILHNQDSEEQQQYADSITQKKKYYKSLKEELLNDNKVKDDIDQFIQDIDQDQQHSKSTSVSGKHKKIKQCSDTQMQTQDQWITGLKQQVIKTKLQLDQVKKSSQKNQKQLDQVKKSSQKNQNQLKETIFRLGKDKECLKQQLNSIKYALQIEKKYMRKFYNRISDNISKKNQIQVKKQQILRKIIEGYSTK